MNRLLPLTAFVLLAGCSAQPDVPTQTQSSTVEQPTAASTPDAPEPPAKPDAPEPPAKEAPPSSAGIPDRFQGRYALDDKACTQPGHESRLILSADRIQFHESSGPVEQVHVAGDTLHVVARLTGEGETRQATYGFALSADGRQLRDVEHGLVRVRCP